MTTKSSNSRRQFLQKITTVAGSAVTLAAASQVGHATPAAPQETAQTPEKSKGYQRTAHVDTYYHLADF